MVLNRVCRNQKLLSIGDLVSHRLLWRITYGFVKRFYKDDGLTFAVITVTDCIEKTGNEWSPIDFYKEIRCPVRDLEKMDSGE